MTNNSTPGYQWSDAWLLLATAIASREAPAPLAAIIATGDRIQHAIFTHAELDRGLGRLLSGGVVQEDAGRYSLALRGKALIVAAQQSAGERLLAQQDALERALGALRLSAETSGALEAAAVGCVVSAAAYDRAVRNYS